MVFTSPKPSVNPNMNKSARAKLAKETVNSTIPHVLQTNERARVGNSNTKLIRYSPGSEDTSASSSTPRISVIKSDTFDAVLNIKARLAQNSNPRIAVLNMCSPLRPGGGVLNGAVAQEESLCMRSTLFASLKDSFYRLPETAAVYSPDVLVFRKSDHQGALMPKSDWFYVDVISCPAVRKPDVDVKVVENIPDLATDEGGSVKKTLKVYAEDKDREAMVLKVRLILQIACSQGIEYLVLGALGCGAYGNPPGEVAKIFKRVICGDKKRAGAALGIKEIIFAIFDEGENLNTFTEVFRDVVS